MILKFISDISSPYEHEYHFGNHESWLQMERRARKLHWSKKTIWYESRKVEEKKYRALRPVSDENKLTWPVRRKQIYIFFGLI